MIKFFKCLPVIRHIRYFYHKCSMIRYYQHWGKVGHLPVNMEHDILILQKVWRGEY